MGQPPGSRIPGPVTRRVSWAVVQSVFRVEVPMRQTFRTGVATGLVVGMLVGSGLATLRRTPIAPVTPATLVPRGRENEFDHLLLLDRAWPKWTAPAPKDDWVPRTINGLPYWIVPLAGGTVVAVDTTRQPG